MSISITQHDVAQGANSALASAQAKENMGKEPWLSANTPEEKKQLLTKELEDRLYNDHGYVDYWLPPSQPSFAYDEGRDVYVIRWPKSQAFDACELDRLFKENVCDYSVEEFHYLPTKLLYADYQWEFHNREDELVEVKPMGTNLVAVCLQWTIFHGDGMRYHSVFNWCPIILMREFNGYYVFSTNADSDVSYEGENHDIIETSFEYMDVLAVKKEVWDGRWTSHVNSILAEGGTRNKAREAK